MGAACGVSGASPQGAKGGVKPASGEESHSPRGALGQPAATLLAVTGLTHRQSYPDIFAITAIKTLAVFLVIAIFYGTGVV